MLFNERLGGIYPARCDRCSNCIPDSMRVVGMCKTCLGLEMPKAEPEPMCGKVCGEKEFAYLRCGRAVRHTGRHKAMARVAEGAARRPLDITIRWGKKTIGLHCSGCEGACDGEGVD